MMSHSNDEPSLGRQHQQEPIISRSVSSHNDPHTAAAGGQTANSTSSLANLIRDQSSCSSLTSGIGQSDQSINAGGSASGNGCEEPPLAQAAEDAHRTDNTDSPAGEPSSTREEPSSSKLDPPDRHRLDIRNFVEIIFTNSESISLERKAEFGRLMQTPEARLVFAKSVDDYRVNSKRVSELTFYSLAQYFSIVLLECLLAEDFRPAKIIMNMMFTYYYEQSYDKIPPRDRLTAEAEQSHHHVTQNSFCDYEENDHKDDDEDNDGRRRDNNSVPTNKTVKTYLYTLLKDQEIFKSIRFWTSAFYETVIIERNNHPVFVDKHRGKLSNEKRDEEMDCSKNITFGLLGSFIHNMCLLDLSHEFCQEFLDKHSTIANLSDCQLEMLRANLKAMFKESTGALPISQATASERLSMFLHRISTRLNNSSQQQMQQQPR